MLDINKSQEVAEFMRARHQYGGELFAEALNEIEQLRFKLGETRRDLIKARTSNLALKKVTIYQAARIRELKDDLETAKAAIKFDREEIERLQEFRDRIARILKQPLTDCDDLLILSLDSVICYRRRQATRIKGLEDATPKIKRCYSCGRSLDEIDCDNFTCCDCAPSWQITDERKAAIEAMCNLSTDIVCPACGAWIAFDDIRAHMGVLRGMLEEAGE